MKFPNQDMPNSGDFPNPLDAVRKMSGMKQHEHHKIVAASLKMMGVKPEDVSDVERLLREARTRIKNVRDYANLIAQTHIDEGKPLDERILAEDVLKRFIMDFDHYGKDELLLFLSQFLAEMTMREIV